LTTKGGLISSVKNRLLHKKISSGIHLVAEKIPKFFSFSLGLFINHGSRDESPEDNGITHLLEHMLFKGTSQKSSLDIVKLIEGLGGSFDAYTTKENLIISTKFLSEHMTRVFQLIIELLVESKIADSELKKEKSVILEEIKSSNEDPGDHVFDLIFQALFPHHTMGLPIAGTKQSVRRFDAARTKAHYRKLLKSDMVLAISGNFDEQNLLALSQKAFGEHTARAVERTEPSHHAQRYIVEKKSEISQVHVVFGVPGVAYTSSLRYPFSIINTAFGGGMSSRLFQGLREQEGLVYNVQSFIDLYSDCGVSGFYFICDKRNVPKVARQLRRIFSDISKKGFDNDEIELAKTYLSGNLLLSLESSTNRMLRLGREMTYLGENVPIESMINTIRGISTEQVNALIPDYLDPTAFTIAAIGPVTEKYIRETFAF
jgi:predicted Zn-dependent peptidase